MADRAAIAAAEIATLSQKLAAAEARIRELEDKDNAFKPLTSWKSDKTKCAPTLDELRECMAALNCERSGNPHIQHAYPARSHTCPGADVCCR